MTVSARDLNYLKKAPAVDGVMPEILSRWSPRAFSERDLSPADLRTIFEAARWAPSSYNEQPWRFLLGTRGSETWQKIFATLVPFNQMWAGHAAALILGTARTTFSHNDAHNWVALFDLGAASAYLVLQAHQRGLAAHQMAGYDQDAARAAFAIPEKYLLGSVIAVGYQAEPDVLTNEQMHAQEIGPRQRKPLSEIVLQAWDTPADIG
jgi:nitroreductase